MHLQKPLSGQWTQWASLMLAFFVQFLIAGLPSWCSHGLAKPHWHVKNIQTHIFTLYLYIYMVLSTSENHDWGKESPAINTTKHWRSMDDPQLNQKMGVKVKHVNASHYEGILITRSQIKRQETVNINHRGFSMPRTWLLNTMAPVSGCWRLSSTFQTSGQQCKWIGHNRGLCTPDFWAGGTNYSNPLIESHLSLHAGNMMWEKGWQKHYRDTEKAEVLLLQNSMIRRRGLQFHQCKSERKLCRCFQLTSTEC